MDKDSPIYKKTSFSTILEEIHSNQKKKDRQINLLIAELKPLIKNISDATIVVPLIKDYIDMGVKNDAHLIQIASILQRWMSNETKASIAGGDNLLITEEEKERLLQELGSVGEDLEDLEKNEVNKNIESIKSELEESDELP